MRRLLLLIALVAVSAQAQSSVGESINGFPNWPERVILEWMNRARVDPQVEMAGCGAACTDRGCYMPMAPLMWSEALNHSARFHADEMARQRYFGHDSQCTVVPNINTLYPVGCDGAASCGCVGGADSCASGGCTPWYGRVGLFGAAPAGEIIAGTSDPDYAFRLWLNEPSSGTDCAFTPQNGHRFLILTSAGAVGVGVTRQVVGDFGGGGTPYKIPSGAHYPQQAAAVDLWANWYDTAAPRSANAVVDGRCVTMSLRRGTPKNGAWFATANGVGSGCHRYYFSFIDGSGIEVTYPATGSLGIGCADWDSSRMVASCASSTSSRHRASRH
jgi:uncharacterized protein YkwD